MPTVTLDTQLYTLPLFLAEKEAAYFFVKLLKAKVEKINPEIESLKYKQPLAVENACNESVSIITGPPGTGKTTTLRKVIDSFIKAGLTGRVFSPTGKAAKRADEVINSGRSFVDAVKCSTVHAGLQWEGASQSFAFNRLNRLKDDYIVLDEFPMQDAENFRDLVEAIKPGKTRLVLCGDPYQLPSVGPGNVARDLLSTGKIPTVALDVILRTGENSGITYNANRIFNGLDVCKTDPVSGKDFKDFFFVARKNEDATCKSIIQYITEDLPQKRNFNPLQDIQLMCPGKISFCGTKNMNRALREVLVPTKTTQVGGFQIGDKLIHLRNDRARNLVNGDVGFVEDVIKGERGGHLVINFGPRTGPNQDGIAEFRGEQLQKLQLAFALTVHKSQGSEFPVAILPIHTCHTILLTRNLVYTGLTRGKQLGLFVGDIEALRRAIWNNRSEQRMTGLPEYITAMAA
jgi:exodeoxyribonuclease V alpha subunit